MAASKKPAAKKPAAKKAGAKKPAPAAAAPRAPKRAARGRAADRVAEAPVEPLGPAPSKGRNLVVVESPAKAKTIEKYLGRGFVVKASMGHVRDLPGSEFGFDPDEGFEASYEVIPGKKKVVAELRKLAKA